MRTALRIYFVAALLTALPMLSSAEVKVTLKNGREIIADSCREAKGKLICEKIGGSFELEKMDVLDFRRTTIRYVEMPENSAAEPDSATEGQKEAAKAVDGAKNGANPEEGVLIRGANPDQEKRLDQIMQRKLELRSERGKLSGEREQLHQDVKEMGMIYKQEQFDGIKKRIADVEGKIGRFNEEVKGLNEEEEKIIGALKGKQ